MPSRGHGAGSVCFNKGGSESGYAAVFDGLRRLLTAVLFTIIATSVATAAEPDSPRVLVAPHWPPYLTGDDNRPGFAVEIVTSAFATVDVNVEIVLVPWRRVMWAARNQQADGLVGAWYREARTEYLRFSDPYFRSPIVAAYNRDNPLPGCELENLAGRRIGMRKGAWYGRKLMNNQQIEQIKVPHDRNMLNMLSQQRLDGAIGDALIFRDLIQKVPGLNESLALCDTPLATLPLHFAAARSAPDTERLVEQFNQGLDNLEKSGKLRAIREKYGAWQGETTSSDGAERQR